MKCFKKVVFTNFWDVLKNHKKDDDITFHVQHDNNRITLEESKETNGEED